MFASEECKLWHAPPPSSPSHMWASPSVAHPSAPLSAPRPPPSSAAPSLCEPAAPAAEKQQWVTDCLVHFDSGLCFLNKHQSWRWCCKETIYSFNQFSLFHKCVASSGAKRPSSLNTVQLTVLCVNKSQHKTTEHTICCFRNTELHTHTEHIYQTAIFFLTVCNAAHFDARYLIPVWKCTDGSHVFLSLTT